MPVHDWTRVDAGVFHAFHIGWMWELQETFNSGLLPADYYSLVEQHASDESRAAASWIGDLLTLYGGEPGQGSTPASHGSVALAANPPKISHRATLQPDYRLLRRTLAIRHVTGHHLVAVVEMVSPANKDRLQNVDRLASKIVAFLDAGVHVLLIDLLPPTPSAPRGIHGALGLWSDEAGGANGRPPDQPLTLASYRADDPPEAFFEHLSVGHELPDMPLFLDPEHYVNAPLESTYSSAFAAMPEVWRKVLSTPV